MFHCIEETILLNDYSYLSGGKQSIIFNLFQCQFFFSKKYKAVKLGPMLFNNPMLLLLTLNSKALQLGGSCHSARSEDCDNAPSFI